MSPATNARPEPRSARRAILSAGPYLILVGAGAYLAARWSDLPERFPIHRNAHGELNGWATRSFISVFGILVVGAAICLGMALLSYAVSQLRMEREAARLTARILLGAQYFLAVLFGGLGLLPLARRPQPFLHLILPATVVFVLAVIVAAARAARKVAGPDPNWKWGLFYVNRADKAVWVPKRLGIGYTLNFAKPLSWLLLVLLLAPALVAIAFALQA